MLSQSRHAIVTAFTGTLLTLASLAAHAQKPALTQNIDEKGRVPYHSSAEASCSSTQCLLSFMVVPTGYRLVITHASLFYLGRPAPSIYPNFVVLEGGANNPGESEGYQEYLPTPTSAGNNYYIASSPVTYYVEAGGTPSIIVNGTANESFTNASISGYLINLNQ
jgi:hypothetical protein